MRFSADADDHTRVLGSGLSDGPRERLSPWRKPSASLVDPVCSGYGPAPSVPSRKTAPVAASAVASLSPRPARGRGRGRTSGRVFAPYKKWPLTGSPSPWDGPPSRAGERAPGRPSGHFAQHAGRDQSYGEVEPGTGGDTEPAGEQATGDQRLPKRDGAGRLQPGTGASRKRGDPAGRRLQPIEFAAAAPCCLGDAVEIEALEIPSPLPREHVEPRPHLLVPHLSTGEQAPRSGDPGS